MSTTFSRQMRLLGESANTLTEEGDGMHTRLVFDAHTDLANLFAYVTSPVTFCFNSNGIAGAPTSTEFAAQATDREMFLGEVPVIVPRGARRLVCVFGFYLFNSAGTDMAWTNFKLYLSSTAYNGPGSPSAFDTTKLHPTYQTVTIASSGTWTSDGTSAYQNVDESAGGIVNPIGEGSIGTLYDTPAYLILTVTGRYTTLGVDPSTGVLLADFTSWYLYE